MYEYPHGGHRDDASPSDFGQGDAHVNVPLPTVWYKMSVNPPLMLRAKQAETSEFLPVLQQWLQLHCYSRTAVYLLAFPTNALV